MSRVFALTETVNTEGSQALYLYDFRTDDASLMVAIIEWASRLPNQGQYHPLLEIACLSDAPPSPMQFHIKTNLYGADLAAEFKLRFL